MFLSGFYRFYFAVIFGAVIYFFVAENWLLWVISAILFRIAWYVIEHAISDYRVNKLFKTHENEFKCAFGPYGIRIINKAENDLRFKRSLAEVFTENNKALKETVAQLEVMDTLFKSGLQPDGDEYLLHDLKLKYGKQRLEALEKR